MMTQKLGDGFEFKKKACFVCGSLNHLIKDYNFYENKMVGKSVLNNEVKDTDQREVRPEWNNAQRVNYQNKLTHPHPRRNFVSTAILTKFGQVPVNTAKQRAAVSISTARPVNAAAPKPKVNDALPITYSYFKAHSPIRRPFNQKSAAKTNTFKEKVNTARFTNVTTTGPKAVVNVAKGKRDNVVKSSACWIWRPKGNFIDHISKDSGSYTPKRFNYGNLQYALQDQGIFDSGYSRHMTGNKFYLLDYQEIDGGFVAFAESPKRGIDYDEVFAPVAMIEAIRLFLAYASFMGFIVYQMDVKIVFVYGTIEEEVAWYETLSTYLLKNGFRRGFIDKTLFIKKDKDDAQEIPDEFYGRAYFLLMIATSTPIETNKALIKDVEAEDVDVHLYRSMIGSLMY
ncbi:ribonuclease H-like domain-containing protein, partial [Tanacetum coccineum]